MRLDELDTKVKLWYNIKWTIYDRPPVVSRITGIHILGAVSNYFRTASMSVLHIYLMSNIVRQSLVQLINDRPSWLGYNRSGQCRIFKSRIEFEPFGQYFF